MEIETLNSELNFSGRKTINTFSSSAFDLPALIEMMKHSDTWSKGELNTLILVKNPDEKVLLTAIHKGTEINSFQEHDSVTFQILEGELRYSTHNDSVILVKGQLLTIREKIKYRLIAGDETVFLLTLLNDNLKLA